MKTISALIYLIPALAFAGESADSKKTVVPPQEEDRWKFTIAIPGWMAGVSGDTGFGNHIANVDIPFWNGIFDHIDMIWATRVEASKGRFGVLGELIYLGLSDGVGTNGGLIKKADFELDEYLCDFAMRWRIVEGPRGYLDLLVGVRYTSIYQAVRLQSNNDVIATTSANLVNGISVRLRDNILERISDDRFRSQLLNVIDTRVVDRLEEVVGEQREDRELPDGSRAADIPPRLRKELERIVERERAELITVARQTARAAAQAEAAALRATLAADRAALRARAAALRERVELRISAAQAKLEKRIQRALEGALNQKVSSFNDWWDPYIGLRGRYNFTDKYYITARGDIGGFSVGSDLMWQAEAAFGVQLSKSLFAEFGYRALAFDYESGNYVNDTITHGAQVTVGVTF